MCGAFALEKAAQPGFSLDFGIKRPHLDLALVVIWNKKGRWLGPAPKKMANHHLREKQGKADIRESPRQLSSKQFPDGIQHQ